MTSTISGVRGMRLPNLEAYGLAKKMKLAAALIAEQGKLRQRASELGTEQQQLKEEIKRRTQTRAHTGVRPRHARRRGAAHG